MVMTNCGICHKKVGKENSATWLACVSCGKTFHGICLRMEVEQIGAVKTQGDPWKCVTCGDKAQSVRGEDRPSTDATGDALEKFRETFERELQKLCRSLSKTSAKMDEIARSVGETKSQVQELIETLGTLRGENEHLKAENDRLRHRVVDLERSEELTSVEIHGVPEALGNDDIYAKAGEILSSALETDITEAEISDGFIIRRSGKKRITRASAAEGGGDIMVVRFTTRRLRESVLQLARKRQKKPDKPVGASGSSTLDGKSSSTPRMLGASTSDGMKFNVQIRERISAYTRGLLRETREMARERGWDFVWVRHGRVLVRKKEKERIHFVNSTSDLNSI